MSLKKTNVIEKYNTIFFKTTERISFETNSRCVFWSRDHREIFRQLRCWRCFLFFSISLAAVVARNKCAKESHTKAAYPRRLWRVHKFRRAYQARALWGLSDVPLAPSLETPFLCVMRSPFRAMNPPFSLFRCQFWSHYA